ncbi:MAG: hypothetical protein AABY22_11195 [Nanoarchaeota archaeon]
MKLELLWSRVKEGNLTTIAMLGILLIFVAMLSQVILLIGTVILIYVFARYYINRKKKESEKGKEV